MIALLLVYIFSNPFYHLHISSCVYCYYWRLTRTSARRLAFVLCRAVQKKVTFREAKYPDSENLGDKVRCLESPNKVRRESVLISVGLVLATDRSPNTLFMAALGKS